MTSGGALCTCGFWAQPVHTRETHAWNFVTAELRCSPCLIENCPQMSKIKQLNRGETLAINMVMGMDVFIKLKCKMQGKLKNRGWERNMLFWSSSLRDLNGTCWKNSYFICLRPTREYGRMKNVRISYIDDLNQAFNSDQPCPARNGPFWENNSGLVCLPARK